MKLSPFRCSRNFGLRAVRRTVPQEPKFLMMAFCFARAKGNQVLPKSSISATAEGCITARNSTPCRWIVGDTPK